MKQKQSTPKYPGIRAAMDGNTAAIMCERESTDGAGAYPITPSTQMGEYWAEAAAAGHINISGRPLIFVEPEGEHAAAAVTAGMSMTGLRATNFSSGQGIAYMHESLYAAVGKRLTYVLNIGCRAMTKASLNVHAGHDDYHCVDDTGFFQVMAKNAQAVADLNIMSHRIAELALTPGIVGQDGFLTTHLIESLMIPERELIAEYLGRPDDIIDTPTPAQKIIYGEKRRRIPELWTVDDPVLAGPVQNQDSYMQSVAAQRPYFFDHVQAITDEAFDAFYELTGRRYSRVMTYRTDDADYLIVGQGSVNPTAEAVADWMREERGVKVGVVDVVMFRPFPGDLLSQVLKGRKGVAVLERTDQPLASDLPLMREIRATLSKSLENGRSRNGRAYPELDTYKSLKDMPELYSGSFGMGSRDLQPEGVVAAIENMLPDGKHKRMFYLSIDFVRKSMMTPMQEVYNQQVLDAYPAVEDLALRGSENPNLMPKDSITVRMHSVGGWGAITTGKNLAMTLYELLGYHIKANPKYGSEKKGQPTSYYLSAAPEPIRINCEYFYVDVVLSPDPNVFGHTNALAGLKKGGVLVMQSDAASAEEFWHLIPMRYRKQIVENDVRIFFLDAFKIARDEATDPELQLRMQGIAFQGAFFATSPLLEKHGLSQEKLLDAIRDQLQHKFGSKGVRVVEDNMRVVRRGFEEITEVTDKHLEERADAKAGGSTLPVPVMVKRLPASDSPSSDIHRFWAQTGSMYASGQGEQVPADPFMSMSLMPAVSSHFRDMTGIRFEHPEFIPENCTACGDCYTVCPDTAIPGLVNEVGQVLDTVVKRLKKNGKSTEQLPRAVRKMESTLRKSLVDAAETESVSDLLEEAIQATIEAAPKESDERQQLTDEFADFREELGSFQFSLTRPYFTTPEKKAAGSGGLFSITIDPYTCKGCMECIEVCSDDALRPVTQTRESVADLRKNWDFWLDLPNTPEKYIRVDDLEEGIGALETILLNKDAYLPFASGDGSCLGCSEKTVVHLFVATVESLMQPRVKAHVAKLDDLIAKLKQHIKLKLVGEIDVGDAAEMKAVLDGDSGELTLARIAESVERTHEAEPIDREWLKAVTDLVARLQDLRWRYEKGTTGSGRSTMGFLNATGCTSVWGSTFPFNPYPFPWANHLFQDPASMAMGVFEGHMAKMADGFKAVRMAEALLEGEYNADEQEERYRYFNWQDFTDEEYHLCPPVVAVGGDGAMYDIGFQNLSRALMSGKPIKVLVVDTQVYSNTGGQACTSGFFGQISDMAQFGNAIKGKEEVRKEMGLIAIAHRTTYFLQSTIAHANHMIEGFVEGLMSRRPALFNLYSSCQPEHGIGDDMSHHQAKLAVESRAYPLFRYNPDGGLTVGECLDLDGNPNPTLDWPVAKVDYVDDRGREQTMELPTTFVDFAVTESRFRKHFRKIPRDSWNEDMVQVGEYLALDEDDREGKVPFVWALDAKQKLSRLLVAQPMIESAEERRAFWIMLRDLGGAEDAAAEVDEVQIESRVRQEVVQKLASGLMGLVSGSQALDMDAMLEAVSSTPAAGQKPQLAAVETAAPAPAVEGDYMAPWIDTEECTACDECIDINPQIFAYNDDKKAVIKNPNGGPYRDLVKSAEKCTAEVIHPGLPRDRSEKDIDKWIKRGEKFN
ncbi:MAG: 2-oxoacid:acceptor oxidoreductase family protein [Gammaproteobacteria bacterium]|nr:2-oxoacid:acceptor oxidoreductase family protein [Gammaproteobacteria bacterium]MBT8110309.1 2-oxoacid:acceptor oxidoreductase family protein [Gammaproteobacteria bacterium]NNL45012.1 pyruvate ferredoxin oxidoreductase [Woeseiaceae bacterium]